VLDLGEPSAVTNTMGAYTLSNLGPGTHVLREVVQAGWEQTAPAGGSYSVSLTSGQTITGRDFGNRSGTITGAKFNDLNGNGVRNPGEPGLGGWTIYLDLNRVVAQYRGAVSPPRGGRIFHAA
jgi:hypothetical protein